MSAGNRNEIGVRAHRDSHPQNLPKTFKKKLRNLNINQYQSVRPTCVIAAAVLSFPPP
jgi:hypothetical protein